MKMGHLPADWRAMTPMDWQLRLQAWNDVNGGESVAPPTREEFDELVEKYG